MALGWYLRRLASMSPAEVVHRAGEQGRRAYSRRRAYGWSAFAGAGAGVAPAVPGLRAAVLGSATPALREAVRASTREHLAGRFSALGQRWPDRDPADLFPVELWRLDPVTGRLWPGADRFTFDIGYRHERGLGDIKFVWEMNRLQLLQPLAAAYALDGDAAALAAVEAAVLSWTANNPPFKGVGWNSGIEIALRAVSVLVAGSLCGDALSDEARRRMRALLSASLLWLRRFPSRFSSANNHLVAEAMGEFLIGLCLPEAPGAAAARRQGRGVLEREASLQVLDDGCGAEQSPTYAAFTVEMLALAVFAAREAGEPLAPEVMARLGAFADAMSWMVEDDGRTPSIGDDDEGRVLTLAHRPERTHVASVTGAVAGLLGRETMAGSPPAPPELRDAVFGSPSRRGPVPQGRRLFKAGGLTVVREARAGRRLQVVVDHGPLGYLSIAAHGHADAGQVLLAVDGRPVLVDPGTYLYHSGADWRSHFRGTRAHNVLALEGLDQSVISGAFNWSHKATAWLADEDGGQGAAWSLTVGHDGYRKRLGVDVLRTVSAKADGLEVWDRLEPRRGLAVEVGWQLAPDLAVEGQGASRTVLRDGRPILEVAFDAPGEVEVHAGGEPGSGGWVSPAFGEKQAAPRIAWRGSAPADGLRTRLRLL